MGERAERKGKAVTELSSEGHIGIGDERRYQEFRELPGSSSSWQNSEHRLQGKRARDGSERLARARL